MSELSMEVAALGARRSRRAGRKPPLDPALQTQRNLAIFKQVEIEKRTHEEVAGLHRLRRSRVTQIVKQVRRELARASADDPQIESRLAQQRLQKGLEKLRLEYALDAAAEALRREAPRLVTNRHGNRNRNGQQEGWSETILRDKPPNVQLIKTYLRVTRELGQLNEREIEGNPVGEKHDQYDLFRAVAAVLGEWSMTAASREDACSPAFLEMVCDFERNLRQWMYQISSGATPADAWPGPHSQPRLEEADSSDEVSTSINHPAPEINHRLTMPDEYGADGTFESERR